MHKIAAAYWQNLKPFEREYVQQRADIDGIQTLKLIINTARRLYPQYIKIYGKGFIELPNGEKRVWSGSDSRKFYKIVNDSIVFDE